MELITFLLKTLVIVIGIYSLRKLSKEEHKRKSNYISTSILIIYTIIELILPFADTNFIGIHREVINAKESISLYIINKNIEKGDSFYNKNEFDRAYNFYTDAHEDLNYLERHNLENVNEDYYALVKSELTLKVKLVTIANLIKK